MSIIHETIWQIILNKIAWKNALTNNITRNVSMWNEKQEKPTNFQLKHYMKYKINKRSKNKFETKTSTHMKNHIWMIIKLSLNSMSCEEVHWHGSSKSHKSNVSHHRSTVSIKCDDFILFWYWFSVIANEFYKMKVCQFCWISSTTFLMMFDVHKRILVDNYVVAKIEMKTNSYHSIFLAQILMQNFYTSTCRKYGHSWKEYYGILIYVHLSHETLHRM